MDSWQPCSDHEWIKQVVKDLRDNKKFWHRLLDSKWCYWIVTGLVLLMIAFIGWVVDGTYAQDAKIEANKKAVQSIEKSVEKIEKEVKEIKQEIKNDQERRAEQRVQDQKELMNVLMEIKKEVKK